MIVTPSPLDTESWSSSTSERSSNTNNSKADRNNRLTAVPPYRGSLGISLTPDIYKPRPRSMRNTLNMDNTSNLPTAVPPTNNSNSTNAPPTPSNRTCNSRTISSSNNKGEIAVMMDGVVAVITTLILPTDPTNPLTLLLSHYGLNTY
jgi:hypothetical protein